MPSTLVALCECGCGQPAPIAKVNMAWRGFKKGDPQRYIRGHKKLKLVTDTYRSKMVNGEPKRLHVLRAEKALGKPLPAGAVVHHADGSKDDDAPLVICQDQGYHRMLHARMRVKALGGDPNKDAYCGHCRQIKSQYLFSGDKTNLSTGLYRWCRQCNNQAQRERRNRSQSCPTH